MTQDPHHVYLPIDPSGEPVVSRCTRPSCDGCSHGDARFLTRAAAERYAAREKTVNA